MAVPEHTDQRYTVRIALIVALGGFLMGFDASVISGVVSFIEPEFGLSKLELGWAVASLTLTATLAMLCAGPLSDRIGRRTVLLLAAAMFAISAVASAIAPGFVSLLLARMIGGFGVGAALIIAPMYIAEMAPASARGRLVSLNQLNIVVGISVAFFSNYLILQFGQSAYAWVASLGLDRWTWRWMLGVETLPAVIYFIALLAVPESPRWLAMRGRDEDAFKVFAHVYGWDHARAELQKVCGQLAAGAVEQAAPLKELFRPAMRQVMTIAILVAILQQITGINAVFFYAPMIFEEAGIGRDAAFMQAVLVGLVNIVFTVAAILLIDKVGRRPLLLSGLTGIAVSMLLLAYGFAAEQYALILAALLGFVACFAISLGPVMWVLFSELFPNRLRGLAISFAGLVNSACSFFVQLVFPWSLDNLGSSFTFLIFGMCAVAGLFLLIRLLPETKGRSLEELEQMLVRA